MANQAHLRRNLFNHCGPSIVLQKIMPSLPIRFVCLSFGRLSSSLITLAKSLQYIQSSLDTVDQLNTWAKNGDLDIGADGKDTLRQLNDVHEQINRTISSFHSQLLDESAHVKVEALFYFLQPFSNYICRN